MARCLRGRRGSGEALREPGQGGLGELDLTAQEAVLGGLAGGGVERIELAVIADTEEFFAMLRGLVGVGESG